MPARILDRETGGNTTYTRAIASRLPSDEFTVRRLPMGRHPSLTILSENASAARRRPGSLTHFTADTGPLVPRRTPTVLTVHGVASRWISAARNRRQESVWRFRVRAALECADAVITVSHSSARDIEAVFGRPVDTTRVIYHGIDDAYFLPEAPPESELVERLSGEPFILFVGNLEPRKNLRALIQAHSILFQRGAAPQLVVAGRIAWNADEISREISEAPGVAYVGFVSEEEKRWLYRQCELFVFPSLYEGFGFPVLEALASGARVLCSQRGSLAEVAQPAHTVSDLSAKGLADAMSMLLDCGRPSTAQISEWRSWASRFTWAKSIEAHMEVYRSVVKS